MTMVLASRLTRVMDKLISPNQSTFLKGCLWVYGVVVLNELVDFTKKIKKECLIFKMDFEKAYNFVNWIFLDNMLARFGFSVKWCAWIYAYAFSVNLVIFVNESPIKEISIHKSRE